MAAAAGAAGAAGAAEDVDVEAVGAEAAVMATSSRLSKFVTNRVVGACIHNKT